MRVHLMVSRREDGAVAVMVALLTVALLVIAAFTTDFGMAYAQRRALATGADSAALAVVRAARAYELNHLTGTCDDIVNADTALSVGDSAKASTIALAQINANAPFGATLAASDITTRLSCASAGLVSGGLLTATVVVNRTLNPILGGVAGASSMHINRTAVAGMGVVNDVTPVVPIAICTNQAQNIIDQHVAGNDGAQLVTVDKVWGGAAACPGTGGAGNWGWLNFGNGVSATDLVSYISGAVPFTVTIDPLTASDPILGTPGNKVDSTQVVIAMKTLIDKNKPVVFPVYSQVQAGTTGANVYFTVIGFLTLRLCGIEANNKQAISTFSSTCYDSSTAVQLVNDSMQVEFVDYTPAGDMGTVCGIGKACAFDAYVTKLLN
jgi:Putative Flp pilus-assembly TadE/G-like